MGKVIKNNRLILRLRSVGDFGIIKFGFIILLSKGVKMMAGDFEQNETLNTLKAIFEKHRNERVCVVGTMCCGKTTLIQQLFQYNCVDVDKDFWPQISEEEIEILSQTPITNEIINRIFELMYAKVTVKSGQPLFGVLILDCDVVVYLDIADNLLAEHCKKRGDTNFEDALFVKKCIEEDWNTHKAKNEKTFYYLTVTE